MKDWTINREAFKVLSEKRGYQVDIHAEHISGKVIIIRNLRDYKTGKAALAAIEKILLKIPLKEIGDLKL